MKTLITSFIIGVICILLGISNMRGNISSIHSYHRRRVSVEDKIPFGKKVGLGTIICGSAIVVFSGFSAMALYSGNQLFILIGSGFLISGLMAGLGISIHAMIKYNKGIF